MEKSRSVDLQIAEFLDFKRKERRAYGTLCYYEECLLHYAKDGKWPPTQDDILNFLSHLVDGKHHKPRSPESAEQTYGRYFRALRAFFRFCYREKNPMEGLKVKAPRLILPSLPSPEKLAQINKIPSLRDKAILALMLETGVRPGELINLREDQIDWEHSTLVAKGKTGPRPVPFRQTTHRIMLQYLKVKRNPYNSPYFFLTRTGEQLTSGCLNLIFKRIKKILKIQGKFYPYLCRHIFATFALRFGSNIDDIRRVLGHSNYNILNVYLNQSLDDIARSQASWSVVENLRRIKKG
jgi:integrase